ncbi:MAG: TolC family protein [Syntrophorhabdales bacterium]
MKIRHALPAALLVPLLLFCLAGVSRAGEPLTWQQVRATFIATNPTLLAGRLGIEESKAEEITAYLRPNPQLTAATDYIHPFKSYGALDDAQPSISVGYLIERLNKRGLRLETARKGTAVAVSQLADQERTLLFTLRSAFIQVLQQKALLALAREDLAYYDKVLDVSAERFRTGDIARIDLDRLQLIRVQYESELETAIVNLRTAKIQLALETRPDLRAAVQSIDQARSAQQLAEANASTDPTISIDGGRFPQTTVPAPSVVSYVGFSVSIPLRIFDRNQGERLRTKLDVTRNERLRDVTEAQLYSDVDSAHVTLNGTVVLLKPYKTQYLKQATTVRDTVTFSYQRGGASLLDFLQAQADYRSVQIAYLNLVGSYLSAAAQLNLAVGREVIQ